MIGYALRHWRGDLSLPVSYFINGLIGWITVAFVAYGLQAYLEVSSANDQWQIFIYIVLIWVSVAAVTVWQLVGIWRSAGKHPGRGGSQFWAGVARFMVILGVIRLVIEVGTVAFPQLHESITILSGDREMDYSITSSEDGIWLEYRGGITFGAAERLENVLASAPDARVIHLTSYGGRVGAAEDLREVIRSHGLDTYVDAECLSACTIAYTGGHRRYLHPDGQLGFHGSQFPGLTAADLAPENRRIARKTAALGVDREFAEKAYLSQSADFWFPTPEELISSGFVTEIASDVDLMVRVYGLEEAMRIMASHAETPIALDEVTTLESIEANGRKLRRTYVVNLEGFWLSPEFRAESIHNICNSPLKSILRINGLIQEYYVKADGTPIGVIIVTGMECNF